MTFFFISYARKDGIRFADELNHRLDEAGLLAWIDREDLQVGKHWRPSLVKAIDNSLATIVVITPGALASQYVMREWMRAEAKDKDVIPLLFGEIPEEFAENAIFDLQWLDFRYPTELSWEELIAKLQHIEAKVSVDAMVSEAERNLNSAERGKWSDALYILETSDHESATEALVRLISSSTPEVSVRTAFALNNRTHFSDLRSIPGLDKALRINFEARNAADHLVRLNCAESVDCLYRGFQTTKDDHIRRQILQNIAQISHKSAILTLKLLLSNEHNYDISPVVIALGNFGQASSIAIPELIELLPKISDKTRLKVELIRTLGKIGDPEAISVLMETIYSFKAGIQYSHEIEIAVAVIEALGLMTNGMGLQSLIRINTDTRISQRFDGQIQKAIQLAKQRASQAQEE